MSTKLHYYYHTNNYISKHITSISSLFQNNAQLNIILYISWSMTHSIRHFPWDHPINTPPATELNQFHPDPARKLSANLECKHRIMLYWQNLLHILEYFTVLTFHIILNFICDRFYNFNYIVHVYTLVIFTHLWNFSMTYTIAVCTVKNSWWWTEELSETCRVSFQE